MWSTKSVSPSRASKRGGYENPELGKAILSAAVFAASLTFVSCTPEQTEDTGLDSKPDEQPKTVRISIESEIPSLKSYIDENSTVHWAESGDELGILYSYVLEDKFTDPLLVKTSGYTLDADGKAEHTVEITVEDGASSFCFGASYPYVDSYDNGKMTFTLPANQTPAANSFDPAADFLISASPVTSESAPETIAISFRRPVAVAKMTFQGIGEGEKISKIEFTAEKNIAGDFTADLLTADFANRVSYIDGEHYKTITLDMQERTASGNDAVWFTALPADLTGQTISIKVTTDNDTYSKEIALTDREYHLEAGGLTEFTVEGLKGDHAPEPEVLATPVISSVTVEGSSVTVSWAAVEGAADYDVTFAEGWSAAGVSGTSHTFENVPDGTYPAAGITVVANPEDGDELHLVSGAGTWGEDVVVNTTPEPFGVTLSFNLIDYKTSSTVGDISDDDNLVTISHSGSSSCSWRTQSDNGYDGIFYGSNHTIKVRINDSSKKMTGIVLYAAVESGSYKTINIKSCEADWADSEGTYDSSNGQYIWSGNAGTSVAFTTGGSSFVSRIDVTLE